MSKSFLAPLAISCLCLASACSEFNKDVLLEEIEALSCEYQLAELSLGEKAEEVRQLVQQQLENGATDADVTECLRSRYGAGNWYYTEPVQLAEQ